MKEVLSAKQMANFDQRSSNLRFDQAAFRIAKTISVMTITILSSVFTANSAANAISSPKSEPKSEPNNGNYVLETNLVSSFLSIAGISETKPAKNIQERVWANQPITNSVANSLILSAEANKSGLTPDSPEDKATAKLEYEPHTESNSDEVVQPILIGRDSTGRSLIANVLTTLKPLQILAAEIGSFNNSINSELSTNSDNSDLNIKNLNIQKIKLLPKNSIKTSSQLTENLETEIKDISEFAPILIPELPSLVAKVYLPETSDYGLTSGFVWPAQGILSSRFGWRWGRLHQGIDIAAPVGTPILSSADGTVDFAGWNSGGYGNMIDIIHTNGSVTRYAHLSRIRVKKGQSISQSQVIGLMGNTGSSTGPHLHFEIRPNGRAAINPMKFLAQIISKG